MCFGGALQTPGPRRPAGPEVRPDQGDGGRDGGATLPGVTTSSTGRTVEIRPFAKAKQQAPARRRSGGGSDQTPVPEPRLTGDGSARVTQRDRQDTTGSTTPEPQRHDSTGPARTGDGRGDKATLKAQQQQPSPLEHREKERTLGFETAGPWGPVGSVSPSNTVPKIPGDEDVRAGKAPEEAMAENFPESAPDTDVRRKQLRDPGTGRNHRRRPLTRCARGKDGTLAAGPACGHGVSAGLRCGRAQGRALGGRLQCRT